MANLTNEQFMADLEKEFPPDYDWDAVPDPKTLPDVYVVKGQQWKERVFYKHKTKEEAETHAGCVRKWSGVDPRSVRIQLGREKWQTEDHWGVAYRQSEHFGIDKEYATLEEAEAQVKKCKTWPNVIAHTVEISRQKPSDAVSLWFTKMCREDILKGEKVFPMYLP